MKIIKYINKLYTIEPPIYLLNDYILIISISFVIACVKTRHYNPKFVNNLITRKLT